MICLDTLEGRYWNLVAALGDFSFLTQLNEWQQYQLVDTHSVIEALSKSRDTFHMKL